MMKRWQIVGKKTEQSLLSPCKDIERREVDGIQVQYEQRKIKGRGLARQEQKLKRRNEQNDKREREREAGPISQTVLLKINIFQTKSCRL